MHHSQELPLAKSNKNKKRWREEKGYHTKSVNTQANSGGGKNQSVLMQCHFRNEKLSGKHRCEEVLLFYKK